MFQTYRRGLFILSFLAAPVTLYLVYVISPYAQAFYIAMTDWRGVTATPDFIGFDNFIRLFSDGIFCPERHSPRVILLRSRPASCR